MDLNVLLHAHQLAVMRAKGAGDDESRQIHFDKAAQYAEDIGALRIPPNRTVALLSSVARGTLSYGSYAWDSPQKPPSSLDAWENEGGAISRPRATPVAESRLTLPSQYFVGSAVFSDLSLAVAEHARQRQAPMQSDE